MEVLRYTVQYLKFLQNFIFLSIYTGLIYAVGVVVVVVVVVVTVSTHHHSTLFTSLRPFLLLQISICLEEVVNMSLLSEKKLHPYVANLIKYQQPKPGFIELSYYSRDALEHRKTIDKAIAPLLPLSMVVSRGCMDG